MRKKGKGGRRRIILGSICRLSAEQTNVMVTLIHVLLNIFFFCSFFCLPSRTCCRDGIFSAWYMTNIVCFGLLVKQADSLVKPSSVKKPGRNPLKSLSQSSQVSQWPPLSLACLRFPVCVAFGGVRIWIAPSAGPLQKKKCNHADTDTFQVSHGWLAKG